MPKFCPILRPKVVSKEGEETILYPKCLEGKCMGYDEVGKECKMMSRHIIIEGGKVQIDGDVCVSGEVMTYGTAKEENPRW